MVSTISVTTHFLYKHVKIILPHQSLHFSYTNTSKLRHTICMWCPPYQSLHLSYTNMSELSYHINHYAFPIQTCQNHLTLCAYSVHHISHYTYLSYTNMSKLRHTFLVSTISITALFLHKHVKIFLVSTISITTLFLHKHVKTASHHLYMVDTISVTTLSYTNCVHYTFPSQQSTRSITTHCLYKIAKIASIYNCPIYPSLHFATETCKNCVHMQVSTISTTAHSHTNM